MEILYLTASILLRLEEWDKWLFIKLNNQLANPVFDAIMPWLREPLVWVPLYIFLLVFVTSNFQAKGWWWFLFFVCLVAMTDLIGGQFIKDYFRRYRPCYDPEFSFNVRFLLKHCSGSFGFTSNHAANHFGMAAFFFFTFRHLIRNWAWLAILWAVLISFAQIYVGVHYPGDIIGGALYGILLAALMARFFHKKFGFITFDKQPTVE